MKQPAIFLVGPMGAGKSTIGRMLAGKLGYDFVDTDQIIEERTGADVSWIFDVEGESGFRDREGQVLQEFCVASHKVIATGGGIVLRKENRELLSKHTCVIYLSASVEQLTARTARDKKRPLLQVSDPKAKILSLLEERDPLYRDVADFVLHTDGQSPKATAQSILKLLDA